LGPSVRSVSMGWRNRAPPRAVGASKVAVNGFLSRGRMGRFEDAIQLAQVTGGPADIAAVRHYNSRAGISVLAEQQLSSDFGVFARAGWADGNIEPYVVPRGSGADGNARPQQLPGSLCAASSLVGRTDRRAMSNCPDTT